MALFETQTVHFFNFVQNSLLKDYLIEEGFLFFNGVGEVTAPLIVSSVTKIITRRKLYDPQNPFIIVANHRFEKVFNRKAFHCRDLYSLIRKHLLFSSRRSFCGSVTIYPHWLRGGSLAEIALSDTGLISNFDEKKEYFVTNALRLMQGGSGSKIPFEKKPYWTLLGSIIAFIVENKSLLTDPRDSNIIFVGDGPLSTIVPVKVFDMTQLESFLKFYCLTNLYHLMSFSTMNACSSVENNLDGGTLLRYRSLKF